MAGTTESVLDPFGLEDDAADELNLEKERDNWVFHMEVPFFEIKY